MENDWNTIRLFRHLLLTANGEPGSKEGGDLETGQRSINIILLAKLLKLTEQEISASLDKLQITGEIGGG